MFRLNLQNSYDKVKFLTILQFVFVLIGFVGEAFATQTVLNFSFLFQFVILVVAFNFYYNSLSHLYYSYWNISLILAVYYTVSASRNLLVIGGPFVAFLFCLSFVLLAIACYIISSPLYYPRSHWWEYDFRFRTDIKCWVEADGKQYQGRLSDLRRGAACLELFHPVPVGHQIQISTEILNQNFMLDSEIRSRREPIVGRAIIYGVKFINDDLEQKQRLKFLTHYWNESKQIKIRNKFANHNLKA